MTCRNCTESHVYDLRCCAACRMRLVRSCRSTAAPSIARRQQEAMLAAIERIAGPEARLQTIEELRTAA